MNQRHYATIMRIRQLFRPRRTQPMKNRREQTFLWKWKYSEVTCIMGTPQIYLSRQPTGNETLWHIPTSQKISGQRKKIFSFSFCSVITIFQKKSKPIPKRKKQFRVKLKPESSNYLFFDECQIVAILQNRFKSKSKKIYRFSFFLRNSTVKNSNSSYFRFATHWSLLLKCFHLFSINNFMFHVISWSFHLTLSLAVNRKQFKV